IIVGTGAGVEKLTVQFAKMLQGQVWWLLQGPECYFGAGDLYFKFKKMLQSSQHVIAVSKYLYSLSISLGQRHVEWVSLGPNPLIFYPRDVRRQPHSIAIQLIDTPDKGARFALSFAEQAKHEGFEVHFFGGGGLASVVPSDLGRKHGRLDAEGLAKLFSQCSHYLDLSFMEGLGLLPLEAAFCGCRPVMTRKGAPEEIFSDRNATFLDSHLDIEGGWMRIKSSEALKSDDLNELRSSYSTKNAFDQVLVSLRKALS
ncbi:MAG: glycosyltransferase, partial [Proteobacteria bacterium]|nr:glycosyltransferase [Pseudomonadota bacterium]